MCGGSQLFAERLAHTSCDPIALLTCAVRSRPLCGSRMPRVSPLALATENSVALRALHATTHMIDCISACDDSHD